jgi:hypothetical protein
LFGGVGGAHGPTNDRARAHVSMHVALSPLGSRLAQAQQLLLRGWTDGRI